MAQTFSIGVRCMNCGTAWDELVPYQTEVKTSYDGVWLHPADCNGKSDCGGRYVECAVCGLRRQIVRNYK